MNSPYIDSLVEQIQNNKTKEYFKEVLSSYYSCNYRRFMRVYRRVRVY